MKLKGALSQIRPTEEQREKIYGDILNKLSERPPEKEKKETNIVMKKRKIITSVAAAAAAVAIAGGAVYAVSPEVREKVRQVIEIQGLRQYPTEGFSMLGEIGQKLPKDSILFADFENENMYAVGAKKTSENTYSVENIAYGNGNVIVLCNEDGSGFYFEEKQQGTVKIVADLSPEYAFEEGELAKIGYIFDGEASELFNGRIGSDGVSVDFTAEKSGEYKFYIINCCAGLQNYKSITVENRSSAVEYFNLYSADGSIDSLGDSLTVTENDFTEFSEGIRAKLVGVVNCGDFAEVIVEFEFDDDIRNGDYCIFDTELKGAYPDYLIGYSGGGIAVSDSGKAYASFTLNDTEGVPEDHVMTLEIMSLDKANSEGVHNTDETYADDPSVKIYGSFSADFFLGKPLSLYSAKVEPTELTWTHPYMFGSVAEMEMTGLSYSPKKICIDLRMLNDCIVDWRYGRNGAIYYNDTSMFYEPSGDILHILDYETTMDDYIPLKFKMSDGTVKNADFGFPRSDLEVDIDKSTLITDEDWLMASYNIPSDKPATVTFELYGIMDYTDVEAIIFCGKEFPIIERDFGINAALSE